MNKYERYKKVDLPWLEKVPEHWELGRISRIFNLRKEKNNPIVTQEVLSLSAKYGVSPYSEKKEKGGNKPKEDLRNYNVCYPGDILVNCMNIVAGSVGISNYLGAVSPVYYPLVNQNFDLFSTRYMEYVLRTYNFQRSLVGLGKGIQMSESEDGRLFTVRMRISWDMLKTQLLLIPPLVEQEQIADYLDWKINEIDRLIIVEKEKIEKLNRLFEKIISFNSSNMKEESIRKYVNIVRGNSTFTKDDLLSKGTYVALQYGKVYKVDTIDSNYNFYVNDEFYKSSQIVDRNDIIAVYTSETIEDLGHFAFYDRDEKGLIGGEQLLIKPKEGIDPKYLFYCLKKDALLLKKASTGIKVYRFKSNDLKSIKIPVVSLNEQKKIVERIEKKLSIVKSNIDICNSIIGELNSFKYSLISEVVTGKIDVRSVVIPSYEKVDVDISTDEEEIKE